MIFVIRFYQLTLGTLLGGACRFEPSCSEYAIEAHLEHGFLKGVLLTTKRLFCCRPFGPFGYDPVPKKNDVKTNMCQCSHEVKHHG